MKSRTKKRRKPKTNGNIQPKDRKDNKPYYRHKHTFSYRCTTQGFDIKGAKENKAEKSYPTKNPAKCNKSTESIMTPSSPERIS